jgi:hypothetical protein
VNSGLRGIGKTQSRAERLRRVPSLLALVVADLGVGA